MGSLSIVFWALLLSPVAFLIGVPLSYLVPALFYRFRKVPLDKREIGCLARGFLAIVFTLAIVGGVCISGVILTFARSDDYWNYQGAFDYWRMPLEPPYELSMLNSLDEASISTWKSNSCLIAGITQYEKKGKYLAGCNSDPLVHPEMLGYFIFNCQTGELKKYADERNFSSACHEIGYVIPVPLKSVQKNWDVYWESPDRRKK